jgi:spore coat polysaccharide biosynthesis predicted glycosyltransferase SpsG
VVIGQNHHNLNLLFCYRTKLLSIDDMCVREGFEKRAKKDLTRLKLLIDNRASKRLAKRYVA